MARNPATTASPISPVTIVRLAPRAAKRGNVRTPANIRSALRRLVRSRSTPISPPSKPATSRRRSAISGCATISMGSTAPPPERAEDNTGSGGPADRSRGARYSLPRTAASVRCRHRGGGRELMTAAFLVLLLVLFLALLYAGRPFRAWFFTGVAAQFAWAMHAGHPLWLFRAYTVLLWGAGALFGIRALRRRFVAPPLMKILARALPRMGDTERIALEAGTVWWDGELFSGAPDWRRLLQFEPKQLTERERA